MVDAGNALVKLIFGSPYSETKPPGHAFEYSFFELQAYFLSTPTTFP